MYYSDSILKNVFPLLNLFDELNNKSYTYLNYIFNKKEYHDIPLNIYKKGDEYIYEFVVPGFSKDELDVSVSENTLFVKGNRIKNTEDKETSLKEDFVMYPIAESFDRKFTLNPDYEVNDVSYSNGLLKINIRKKKKESIKINIR